MTSIVWTVVLNFNVAWLSTLTHWWYKTKQNGHHFAADIFLCFFFLEQKPLPFDWNMTDGASQRFNWHYPGIVLGNGPLTRCVRLGVAHAPEMPGTFSPPSRVSDPDTHHGTWVTLTSGFFWCRWRGKRSRYSRRMRNPHFCVSGKRSMAWCQTSRWPGWSQINSVRPLVLEQYYTYAFLWRSRMSSDIKTAHALILLIHRPPKVWHHFG